MKRLFYALCLTIIGLACQKSTDVKPDATLYRRWQDVSHPDSYITFRTDGIILYGLDGTYNTCCGPQFFVRRDNLIDFRNAPSKPLPVTLEYNPICSVIDCNAPDENWKIISLTVDKLVIQAWNGQTTYKAD